jgi:ATP-dependent Clp protease ATP-binding subunit ClpA/ATP-dependent Clp protease ATP-binding subunit ClpC
LSERVAAEAFRQEDGARSLKRFLEDRIGSRLSEEIAKAPNAAMQVVRLYADENDEQSDSGFVLEHEPLVEAKPCGERFALEPLLELSLTDLRGRLPELSRELERIEASADYDVIERRIADLLSARRSGTADHDTIFNLDWTRASLRSFHERIDRLLIASRDRAYEEIERAKFGTREVEIGGELVKMRVVSRLGSDGGRTEGTRRELLECFAHAHFLRRSLERVHDTTQHAILLELVPVGNAPRFLGWLGGAYAGWGTLSGWATLASGTIQNGVDKRHLASAISGRQVDVALLAIVGICIKDFAELETGTHVWQGLATAPELVRVRVLPLPDRPLADIAAEFRTKKEAFDRASLGAARGAENPARLLPIARRVRFTPPRAGLAPLELEDYVMGHGGTFHAQNVAEALSSLWLLRMTRQDAQPRGAGHGGRA